MKWILCFLRGHQWEWVATDREREMARFICYRCGKEITACAIDENMSSRYS